MNTRDQQTLLAPASPPLAWRDEDYLYLEYPDHVLRFDNSFEGLTKALKHLPQIAQRRRVAQLTGASNLTPTKSVDKMKNVKQPPTARMAKATAAKRELNGFSDKTKAAAAAIIRKLGTGEH